MKPKIKLYSIIAGIIGLVIVIGLSIWVGFPSPEGFDRTVICYVGYIIGLFLLFFSVGNIFINMQD